MLDSIVRFLPLFVSCRSGTGPVIHDVGSEDIVSIAFQLVTTLVLLLGTAAVSLAQ